MIINVLGVDISLNTYTSYLAYLALLIVLTLSCSATSNTQAPSSFPLLDNRGILHEYKSDAKTYKRITHPSKDKLTLYCGVHRQWETLRIVWRRSSLTKIEHREEADYWRWTYIVNRSKKQ